MDSYDYIHRRISFLSWEYFSRKDEVEIERQKKYQDILKYHMNIKISGDCYISEDANVLVDYMEIGHGSYICGGAIVRDHVIIRDHSSIGSYSTVGGSVLIESHTMIAGGVTICGFSHSTSTDTWMSAQACTVRGVKIGEGCWIGANSTIVDGVEVGVNSIVAAGSVVNRSCPEYSVLAGVPAIIKKNRRGTTDNADG